MEHAAELAHEDRVSGSAELALMVALARARRKTNDWAAAREALERASALTTPSDTSTRARLGLLRGEIALCGRPRDLCLARTTLEGALAENPDDHTRMAIWGHLSLVYQALDDLSASDAAAREAEEAARAVNHPGTLFSAGIFL